MSDELRLSGYREPLGLWVRKSARIAARPGLRTHELEFSSRGDRTYGIVANFTNGGLVSPLRMRGRLRFAGTRIWSRTTP